MIMYHSSRKPFIYISLPWPNINLHQRYLFLSFSLSLFLRARDLNVSAMPRFAVDRLTAIARFIVVQSEACSLRSLRSFCLTDASIISHEICADARYSSPIIWLDRPRASRIGPTSAGGDIA